MDTCACLCELKDPLSSYQQEALPLAYLQCAVVAKVKIKFGECLTKTSGRTKTTTIENAERRFMFDANLFLDPFIIKIFQVFQVSPYQNESQHQASKYL